MEVRYSPRRQCQLCLDSAFHLSPVASRYGRLCAGQGFSDFQNQRGGRDKESYYRSWTSRLHRKPSDQTFSKYADISLSLVFVTPEGRLDKVLFIDARNLGYLINRRIKNFTDEDIARIAGTYHGWRNKTDGYQDVPGFCKSVTLDEIRLKDYVLTPGRYIGLPEDEDDVDFAERFGKLKAELDAQMKEEARLNVFIQENLAKLEVKE